MREHGAAGLQCPHCYFRAASQVTMFVHLRSIHPGLQMGFYAGQSLPAAAGPPAAAAAKGAFPPVSCNLCGFEAVSGGDFTQHLGVHAAEGDGVRSATDVVCANCGACFAGRRCGHGGLEPI